MGSPSTWADLELGTPGTMACIWNWALQGPSWAGTWTLAHISLPLLLLTLQVCSDWSWQQSTGQAHTSLPLLLLTLQVCSDWSWQQSTGQAHTSLPLLLLTLQVCSDWSWQQSTGQAHTSLPLLLLTLQVCSDWSWQQSTGQAHTSLPVCLTHCSPLSLSAGHHSDGITAHGLWNWGLYGLAGHFDLIWSIGGWAPHGPGQTGFQGGLAGPLKGDVLVSRSALSHRSPTALLSLKGPGLLGDGLPMDLDRLDFRAVWLVH